MERTLLESLKMVLEMRRWSWEAELETKDKAIESLGDTSSCCDIASALFITVRIARRIGLHLRARTFEKTPDSMEEIPGVSCIYFYCSGGLE